MDDRIDALFLKITDQCIPLIATDHVLMVYMLGPFPDRRLCDLRIRDLPIIPCCQRLSLCRQLIHIFQPDA